MEGRAGGTRPGVLAKRDSRKGSSEDTARPRRAGHGRLMPSLGKRGVGEGQPHSPERASSGFPEVPAHLPSSPSPEPLHFGSLCHLASRVPGQQETLLACPGWGLPRLPHAFCMQREFSRSLCLREAPLTQELAPSCCTTTAPPFPKEGILGLDQSWPLCPPHPLPGCFTDDHIYNQHLSRGLQYPSLPSSTPAHQVPTGPLPRCQLYRPLHWTPCGPFTLLPTL